MNFNFGAITCVSCKAFFRRNSNKFKDLKCHFGDKCEISLLTRKFCQRCRLKRCFGVGMKIDLMLTEDEKRQYNISEPIINQCSAVVPISRPLTDYRNNFNELEGNKLTEILFATDLIQEPISEVTSIINDMLEYRVKLTYKFTKEILNFPKLTNNVQAFNQLCQNDKIALVKYGAIEIINVRSALLFDTSTQCWSFNTDENNASLLHLDLLKNERNNVYEAYKTFLTKFIPAVDNDPLIMNLFTAILLFNPNRPNLRHKQLVKLQQKSYLHLLQRYFLLKYRSDSEMRAKFTALMNIMPDICVLSGILWRNGVESEPQLMGPLLSEIFDK
ncbi:unnamed protein product [Medioppia subpectinata]|uniref:Uncharacterized protein n=1 Tax=Medioppia subpectinata TaxID=1979941 RepID=A0A7R9KYG4_9ACAR|nr:unnamed protein product [Medioppia subpectinata]CAG2111037.1 unnamed protein product [Medioppia subpectinata]